MYQHPVTLDYLSTSHRDDLVREAQNERLARQIHESTDHSPVSHPRLRLAAAAAAAVLAAVAAVAVL